MEKPDELFNAFTNEKIQEISNRIVEFKEIFDLNIAKIQCLYAIAEQKWEINYVTTNDGKVTGSEKCYKRTI